VANGLAAKSIKITKKIKMLIKVAMIHGCSSVCRPRSHRVAKKV
jgi:hypothetical protein